MNVLDDQSIRKFVDYLTAAYFDERSGTWNKIGDERDYAESTYDFGNSFQMCLALIGPLQQAGHKVNLVGAEANQFPPNTPGNDIGLDWLVVDNHIVVDPWSYDVDHKLKTVYDLNNPRDAQEVERLYPPRELWQSTKYSPKKVEFYSQMWRDYALPFDVVDRLMGQ